MTMLALPRIHNPEHWRARRDKAKAQRRSCSYEQRQLEIAVAAKLRRELKEEKAERAKT